jgi:FkbM family methyltransferase
VTFGSYISATTARAFGPRRCEVSPAAVKETHPRQGLFLAPAEGGIMILKAGDLISDVIAKTGRWDEHIADVIKNVSRARNGKAVDAGTHFGSTTLVMARHFESVLSFEANDFNYRLLKSNVCLNGLSNVECRNQPLFSSETRLSLASQYQQETELPTGSEGTFEPLDSKNLGSYSFSTDGTGIYDHVAIPLDSLHLEDVVFIKIDVQGADGEVLLGAQDTIRRCRPVVVFEWEEHLSANFSVDLDQVRRLFAGLGYAMNRFMQHNDKQVDYVAFPNDETQLAKILAGLTRSAGL